MADIIYFDSIKSYFDSAKNLKDKIAKIDQIIDALLDKGLEQVEVSGEQSYSLDDGQTKISTSFRSSGDIMNAVREYEQLKSLYANRLQGRGFRLMDASNLWRGKLRR
jgi:hypothetical protein